MAAKTLWDQSMGSVIRDVGWWLVFSVCFVGAVLCGTNVFTLAVKAAFDGGNGF
jgi:hypothetical protein